ncbi:hypothetical protein BGZ63DRAFT_489590 [Mariannaea sp. PMI_226]|nr:hypothetical protein BGZ63DRAFT_489590 [Mariannaea sp. PMI_226]
MGAKYGFLIPDSYVQEVPDESDMNIASIFWGLSLGVAIFSALKALKQSHMTWTRSKRVNAYVAMLWGVWLSSMVLGVLAWGFQRQYIRPSFIFYFFVAFFWAVQVQLLLQIILNRLGVLIVIPGQAAKLKWLVFGIILAVNISVFIIWIPARLQINPTWVRVNDIWDRCEKVIFAIVDGILNTYFIYLVRSRLIDNGLSKYIPLYRRNLVLVFISLSLDVILIGLMSLKSSLVYLSFHPVCYLLKLQIEMQMAELIIKIVSSTHDGSKGQDTYYKHPSTGQTSKSEGKSKFSNRLSKGQTSNWPEDVKTQLEASDEDSDLEFENYPWKNGGDVENRVVKTVQTTIPGTLVYKDERDTGSQNSSTHQLHNRTALEH